MNPDLMKEASPLTSPSIGQTENRQKIAERMEALAIELRTLSDNEIQTVPSQSTLLNLAAKIYQARRRVDAIFGLPGFAVSPGWDMMLDLYQAKIQNREISVTSACIGGACAATTGLRWLQVLESKHLIVRRQDALDKRRHMVELTNGGKVRVERALSEHL